MPWTATGSKMGGRGSGSSRTLIRREPASGRMPGEGEGLTFEQLDYHVQPAAPSNAHADWHANSSSRIKHGKPIEVSFCSLISTNISASRNIALISVLKLDLGRHARPPHLSALYCSSSKSFHCILCGMQSSNTTCTMRWKAKFCNCWIMPEKCWCLPEFANVFALHLPVHAKSCCPLVSDPHHTVRQPLRLRYHVIPCAKSSPVYQSGGLIFGST